MTREKHSLGSTFKNEGTKTDHGHEKPYELDHTRKFYLFDVVPVSAPRMTQSDRWKTNPNHPDPRKRQRPAVQAYFKYKNELVRQANILGFEMSSTLDVVFIVPMPNSWSDKKKSRMNGMPCQTKPDTDNYIKAIKDTFCKNDSHVWKVIAEKRWGFKGSVLIFG